MLIEKITAKMIDFSAGNTRDIEHFLKVHAYAELIAGLEETEKRTRELIEITAIVHDISLNVCREKYGRIDGNLQEKESEAVLRPFLEEFALPGEMLDRIVYLVSHHHTYTDVDGIDYQILLEADYLVNASEEKQSAKQIEEFKKRVVKTEAGRRLFDSIYLR